MFCNDTKRVTPPHLNNKSTVAHNNDYAMQKEKKSPFGSVWHQTCRTHRIFAFHCQWHHLWFYVMRTTKSKPRYTSLTSNQNSTVYIAHFIALYLPNLKVNTFRHSFRDSVAMISSLVANGCCYFKMKVIRDTGPMCRVSFLIDIVSLRCVCWFLIQAKVFRLFKIFSENSSKQLPNIL